jgi:opacity protein-like surface antigen
LLYAFRIYFERKKSHINIQPAKRKKGILATLFFVRSKKREFKMSVKKLLVLTAASFAAIGATAAMAGGPDHMAMPSEPAFQNSIYLDGHVGYTQSNWSSFNSNNVMGARGTSLFAPGTNGKGGVTGGADIGYNITQHIAAEAGWFYIPQVKGNGLGSATTAALTNYQQATTTVGKVDSWFAYMAAKLSVPVMENFDLFGKVGVAYRGLTYSPNTLSGVTGHGHYWAPVFGAGLQYTFAQAWMLGAQYMHLPGNSEVNYGNPLFGAPNAAPELNQYTAFLGYKFNV